MRPPALLLTSCCLALAATAADAAAPPEAGAEVQINLCSEPDAIARALELAPSGKPREAWYFDNAALDHFGKGAVFRLRTGAGTQELTLKAANQDCAKVPAALLPKGAAKCEYDVHGSSVVGAVSLTRTLDPAQARKLLDSPAELPDLLSEAQVRYLREGLSAWPLASGMQRLGPARIESWRAAGKHYVVEVWSLPSGKRYIEMSQKTDAGNARRLQARLLDMLAAHGLRACPDQNSMAGEKLADYLR
jgi:hypothetical protein